GAALRGLRARICAEKDKSRKAEQPNRGREGATSTPCICLCRANPRTQSAYEIRGPFRTAAPGKIEQFEQNQSEGCSRTSQFRPAADRTARQPEKPRGRLIVVSGCHIRT